MALDDLKKLFGSRSLYRLDPPLAPRLVPIFYWLGIAAIVLWAITHLFATFALSFGQGVWGLIEIVVFGLLAFCGLRIVAEAVMLYFRSNTGTGDIARGTRASSVSLLDELRDAIRDLADEVEDDYGEADEYGVTPPHAYGAGPAPRSPATGPAATPSAPPPMPHDHALTPSTPPAPPATQDDNLTVRSAPKPRRTAKRTPRRKPEPPAT